MPLSASAPRSIPRRSPRRLALTVTGATCLVAVALLATGCAGADDWSAPRTSTVSPGALPAAFLSPDATPSPSATITPHPGSWNDAQPEPGYRVVLLEASYDPANDELATGTRRWAERAGASVKSVRAESPAGAVSAIVEAMELHPDLIVSTSPALVDALALVTASHLEERFLLIGAQLPEPTANVTAAVWSGASTRGSEVANPADSDLADAYTAEASEHATAAGVAAVLHDLTGIVIDVR